MKTVSVNELTGGEYLAKPVKLEDNQTLFDRLDEFKRFRRPILVGVSRKRFIWQPRGLTPDTCGDIVREYEERARSLGASIIRTHLS